MQIVFFQILIFTVIAKSSLHQKIFQDLLLFQL